MMQRRPAVKLDTDKCFIFEKKTIKMKNTMNEMK